MAIGTGRIQTGGYDPQDPILSTLTHFIPTTTRSTKHLVRAVIAGNVLPPTPFHRPVTFFSDAPRWARSPAVAVGVAVGSALLLAIAVYALGVEFASQFSETVTVDNPAYPGDQFCEINDGSFPSGPEGHDPCDEPATVERDTGPMVREAFNEVAVYAFIGWMLAWAVGVILLHVGAKVADGVADMSDTFAIAAWSGVPSAVATLPTVAVIAYALRSEDLTLEDPETTQAAIEAALASVEPILLVLAVVGTTWQAAVWYGGLRGLHDLDRQKAGVVAAVFWVITLLMSV